MLCNSEDEIISQILIENKLKNTFLMIDIPQAYILEQLKILKDDVLIDAKI